MAAASQADRELHRRLMDGDPTAPSDLAERHVGAVLARLRRRMPAADEAILWHAAAQAVLNLGEQPQRYDPGRLGLLAYLVMDAHGDARHPRARSMNCANLVSAGVVSIIDLSDIDTPAVRNLAIVEILRGVQQARESAYEAAMRAGRPATPVEIFVDEAQGFLSAERIKQMPNLFAQVARIARLGRKRWLGLVFVTQFPQHLTDEVLGLLNN